MSLSLLLHCSIARSWQTGQWQRSLTERTFFDTEKETVKISRLQQQQLSSTANRSPGRAVTLSHPLQLPQMSSQRESHYNHPPPFFFHIREVTLVSAGQPGVFDVHFSTVLQLCLLSTFTIHSQAKVRSSDPTTTPAPSSSLWPLTRISGQHGRQTWLQKK